MGPDTVERVSSLVPMGTYVSHSSAVQGAVQRRATQPNNCRRLPGLSSPADGSQPAAGTAPAPARPRGTWTPLGRPAARRSAGSVEEEEEGAAALLFYGCRRRRRRRRRLRRRESRAAEVRCALARPTPTRIRLSTITSVAALPPPNPTTVGALPPSPTEAATAPSPERRLLRSVSIRNGRRASSPRSPAPDRRRPPSTRAHLYLPTTYLHTARARAQRETGSETRPATPHPTAATPGSPFEISGLPARAKVSRPTRLPVAAQRSG
ncbi:hypothetical protein CDD83_4450 [Cordyceps sp. RAO-2017]|nr:hypothetical protein CDD83_4450 [Cordyceps sp. RAO-2017]